MWALALSAIKHVEYVHPLLGPQNATGPPTVPTENIKSKHSNVGLKMDAISLPQSPQPMLPSHHDNISNNSWTPPWRPSQSSNFQAVPYQTSLLRALMIPLKHSTHLLLWTRQRQVRSLERVKSQSAPLFLTLTTTALIRITVRIPCQIQVLRILALAGYTCIYQSLWTML